MALTVRKIMDTSSDEALIGLLTNELERRIPGHLLDTMDLFVERTRTLPPGLHAMAVTHQLDVSMALDDLGWHFANWHHKPYCEETRKGLRELEANEVADILDRAYEIVMPYWDEMSAMLAVDFFSFVVWYHESTLSKKLQELNCRLWDICEQSKDYGLMSYWLVYARSHPERIVATT